MESKESFENTQTRPGEDIGKEVAAEKNPGDGGQHRPDPNKKESIIHGLMIRYSSGGEVGEGGDEEDAGGVAAGEGEVVNGYGDVHGGGVVVGRARTAEDKLDEADESEVEKEAEEEWGEVGAEQSGAEEEGKGDREEEAKVGGELEEEEEGVGEERPGYGVEVMGEGGVYAY